METSSPLSPSPKGEGADEIMEDKITFDIIIVNLVTPSLYYNDGKTKTYHH